MGLDEQLYQIPFIGKLIERLYSYFKKHTAFTDFIHLIMGAGIGLIIAKFFTWGVILLSIGILGHIYAYIKGDSK